MKIATLAILLCLTSVAHSQTLSPAVSDYRPNKDSVVAELMVTNNSDRRDMAVTLTPHYFQADEKGVIHVAPVPAWMHFEFDQTSAIIGPKGSHIFDYRVTCEGHTNCWWMIEAGMATGQIVNGLAVVIHLPDLGYMVQKEPLRVTDLLTKFAGSALIVQNTSDKFGRVSILEKTGKKVKESGCVAYPQKSCTIPLTGSPNTVEVIAPKGKTILTVPATLAVIAP